MFYKVLVLGEDVESLLEPYHNKPDNPNSKWDWHFVLKDWTDSDGTHYGETVGTTQWKYPDETIEETKQFWIDWVEGKNRERFQKNVPLFEPKYYLDKYKTLENYLKANTYKVDFTIITPDGE